MLLLIQKRLFVLLNRVNYLLEINILWYEFLLGVEEFLKFQEKEPIAHFVQPRRDQNTFKGCLAWYIRAQFVRI